MGNFSPIGKLSSGTAEMRGSVTACACRVALQVHTVARRYVSQRHAAYLIQQKHTGASIGPGSTILDLSPGRFLARAARDRISGQHMHAGSVLDITYIGDVLDFEEAGNEITSDVVDNLMSSIDDELDDEDEGDKDEIKETQSVCA
eukprot:712287-Rhodomonas_salina.2